MEGLSMRLKNLSESATIAMSAKARELKSKGIDVNDNTLEEYIDAETFEVLENGYARDAEQVYYVRSTSTSIHILDADPKTFEILYEYMII